MKKTMICSGKNCTRRMHLFIIPTNQSVLWGRLVPIQQLWLECSSAHICFQYLYVANMCSCSAGTVVWDQSPDVSNTRIARVLWLNSFGATPDLTVPSRVMISPLLHGMNPIHVTRCWEQRKRSWKDTTVYMRNFTRWPSITVVILWSRRHSWFCIYRTLLCIHYSEGWHRRWEDMTWI